MLITVQLLANMMQMCSSCMLLELGPEGYVGQWQRQSYQPNISSLIMPRGSRGIFRVDTKTRWRLHGTENELFVYFSSLIKFHGILVTWCSCWWVSACNKPIKIVKKPCWYDKQQHGVSSGGSSTGRSYLRRFGVSSDSNLLRLLRRFLRCQRDL